PHEHDYRNPRTQRGRNTASPTAGGIAPRESQSGGEAGGGGSRSGGRENAARPTDGDTRNDRATEGGAGRSSQAQSLPRHHRRGGVAEGNPPGSPVAGPRVRSCCWILTSSFTPASRAVSGWRPGPKPPPPPSPA